MGRLNVAFGSKSVFRLLRRHVRLHSESGVKADIPRLRFCAAISAISVIGSTAMSLATTAALMLLLGIALANATTVIESDAGGSDQAGPDILSITGTYDTTTLYLNVSYVSGTFNPSGTNSGVLIGLNTDFNTSTGCCTDKSVFFPIGAEYSLGYTHSLGTSFVLSSFKRFSFVRVQRDSDIRHGRLRSVGPVELDRGQRVFRVWFGVGHGQWQWNVRADRLPWGRIDHLWADIRHSAPRRPPALRDRPRCDGSAWLAQKAEERRCSRGRLIKRSIVFRRYGREALFLFCTPPSMLQCIESGSGPSRKCRDVRLSPKCVPKQTSGELLNLAAWRPGMPVPSSPQIAKFQIRGQFAPASRQL